MSFKLDEISFGSPYHLPTYNIEVKIIIRHTGVCFTAYLCIFMFLCAATYINFYVLIFNPCFPFPESFFLMSLSLECSYVLITFLVACRISCHLMLKHCVVTHTVRFHQLLGKFMNGLRFRSLRFDNKFHVLSL